LFGEADDALAEEAVAPRAAEAMFSERILLS
jgi:hypothetical protein